MLPNGPSTGVLAQTVALHRDPLGTLGGARERYGDAFTIRLATARPIVVVVDPGAVAPLLEADPSLAHAGEARRRILPMASPRSMFGGDGAQHDAARAQVADRFTPQAVGALRGSLEALAERHVAAWPRGRPFRLLPRMRALIDDAFVRLVLGVDDERRALAIAAAIRRMLWTPGNPPLSIPGEGDGLLGAAGAALFERRVRPLSRLLGREVGDPWTVDELIPLLMAAQEPPAAALTWLLERFAREPVWAARYSQGADRDAIVRESLRLRPPAMAALRRLTVERDIAGHRLPAGVIVMLPIPLLHRDPRVFPDPEEFRPDRWTDGGPPGTT